MDARAGTKQRKLPEDGEKCENSGAESEVQDRDHLTIMREESCREGIELIESTISWCVSPLIGASES